MPSTTARSHAYLSVALVFLINMCGTTLPTAIYRDYQIAFGFSPAIITVIYACYAVGVLLLVATGRISLGASAC